VTADMWFMFLWEFNVHFSDELVQVSNSACHFVHVLRGRSALADYDLLAVILENERMSFRLSSLAASLGFASPLGTADALYLCSASLLGCQS